MQLITTRNFRVSDASKPRGEDGFFPKTFLLPGAYQLEEIPNPNPKPEDLDPKFWDATWLVVRGTLKGFSRGAFEHNYIHHHDPSVAINL